MKCFVYIIQSIKLGMYYIGSSINPERRLLEHNLGKVRATRSKGVWVLKFKQEYLTTREARQIEYKLKKLKRRDIIERIIYEKVIKLK